MGYNDNGGEVLQMLTPHLDLFRLAQFQKEMQNSWIPGRQAWRELPPIGGKVEKTMDEVLEQVRQSAKELAENSARLPVTPKCKYELEDLERHRADLERILFLIGVLAGSKGKSLTIKVAIFPGCDAGCCQEHEYECVGPHLAAQFGHNRLTVRTLPTPECSLLKEGVRGLKHFAMDDIQSAIHELMGTTP